MKLSILLISDPALESASPNSVPALTALLQKEVPGSPAWDSPFDFQIHSVTIDEIGKHLGSEPYGHHRVIQAQALAAQTSDSPQTASGPALTFAPDYALIAIAQNTQLHADFTINQGLQRLFPLARQVTIHGAWSSGGGRSGQRWPGSFHVTNTEFTQQFSIFARQWHSGQKTLWDGPATLSTTERLGTTERLALPGNVSNSADLVTTIGLISRDRRSGQALQDGCAALGYPTMVSAWDAHFSAHDSPPLRDEPHLSLPAGPATPVADPNQAVNLWLIDLAPPLPTPQSLAKCLTQVRQKRVAPVLIVCPFYEILADRYQNLGPENTADTAANSSVTFLRKPFLLPELQAAIRNLSFQNR